MIKIITVGSLKEKYLKEAVEEYSKRLRKYTDIEMIEIKDEGLLPPLQAMEKEGEKIKKHLSEKDYIITLEIEGKELSSEELAKKLGKSRSYITNMIGLQTLPDTVQNLISENKLTMGHARVLSKLESKEQQQELANKVINEGMSVRQLETLTQSPEQFARTHKIQKHVSKTNEYQYLEEELCDKLGTKVKIKSNKIEISFVNGNDLNRLLEIMNLETRR